MDNLISIIIPNYNGAAYLRTCLDSVLNQTYENLEILVVDDASKDHSREILREYAERDPRIRPVLKQENGGLSPARNDGLAAAIGEYVMFLDSDDWIDPETCSEVLEAALIHQADVVFFPYIRELGTSSRPRVFYDNDRVFDRDGVRSLLYRRMVGPVGDELWHPENYDAMSTAWAKLYRRDLIENHQLRFINTKIIGTYEDGMFNLEVYQHAQKAVFLKKYFYHYRRCISTSLSTYYRPKLRGQWQTLFQLIRQHLDDKGLEQIFYDALSNRIALSLIQLGINEVESPEGYVAVIRSINQIMQDPQFRESVAKLDFQYLPVHWKVFFGFARMNWATGVYLLLLVIQKIRGR